MGRSLFTPTRDKRGRIERETNAAVGIADTKCRTGNAFPFGYEELQPAICLLRHAQDRHGTDFDFALYPDAKAALAMIELELTQHWTLVGNRQMHRPIVAHQHKL